MGSGTSFETTGTIVSDAVRHSLTSPLAWEFDCQHINDK